MSEAYWYASRATGLVTLVLFTAVMVLGALNAGRLASSRWPRFAVSGVHRNLSLLSLAFLAVHVATSIIDPYAGIGWVSAIVPFTASYRPFWLSLGAIGGDLMIAIVVTSLIRSRISLRVWRALHWTAYLCWPVAVAHGLGSALYDTRLRWVVAVNVLCVLVVLVAIGWRVRSTHADSVARRGGSVEVGR
jgi:predicted ferric reductase